MDVLVTRHQMRILGRAGGRFQLVPGQHPNLGGKEAAASWQQSGHRADRKLKGSAIQ